MTENCLVRVHQEMDERENSLRVVGMGGGARPAGC